jgi:hypothetical protein
MRSGNEKFSTKIQIHRGERNKTLVFLFLIEVIFL